MLFRDGGWWVSLIRLWYNICAEHFLVCQVYLYIQTQRAPPPPLKSLLHSHPPLLSYPLLCYYRADPLNSLILLQTHHAADPILRSAAALVYVPSVAQTDN